MPGARAEQGLATERVDPWDLDEYARDVHHLWSYWMTKAKHAMEEGGAEEDTDAAEKYTGKLAFLSDKVVAICKVRALWAAASPSLLKADPEPDPLDDPNLSPELRKKMLEEKTRLEGELRIERARRKLADLKDNIRDEREMTALYGGAPIFSEERKRKSISANEKEGTP
jgi:hypothetical protein